MSQPNPKKPADADADVASRKRSGMRRIDPAAGGAASVPRAPRLPLVDWAVDRDQDPTQPELEAPTSPTPTLPAPAPAPAATHDVDEERDTIPSPAPDVG